MAAAKSERRAALAVLAAERAVLRKAPATKEERQDKHRAWVAANHERYRELQRRWRAANHEKVAAARKVRKANKSYGLKTYLRLAQKNRCAYCREILKDGKTHVDHIIALSKGGGNERSNLQLACAACNIAKSNKDPIVFAQSVGLML